MSCGGSGEMRAPWVRGSERDFTWMAICHSCQSIFHFRRVFRGGGVHLPKESTDLGLALINETEPHVGLLKPKPTASRAKAPSTVRPLARDLRVLIGWPFPLGFGLDGRLLLARRGRVYV